MSRQIVVVLGAGSWGTSLALLAARNGHEVRLWARSEESARRLTIDQENVKYLPGVSLHNIAVAADLESAVTDVNWIIGAVPCSGVPALAQSLKDMAPAKAVVISGTKGLHPESGERSAQLWNNAMSLSPSRYVALSGPNLAKEIIAGVPTSTVVSSEDDETARRAQTLLNSRTFRVYTNTDLIGVELGGALKNVVAIVAGITDGLGFGDNAKGAIVTRHWREMTRLAMALNAKEATLFGLSGMGDLFATCVSPHSRNHKLGFCIGQGESLGEAQREVRQVTEGVHTTRAALHLAQETGVELPVTEQLAAILFEGRNVRRAVEDLMGRQECSEY